MSSGNLVPGARGNHRLRRRRKRSETEIDFVERAVRKRREHIQHLMRIGADSSRIELANIRLTRMRRRLRED